MGRRPRIGLALLGALATCDRSDGPASSEEPSPAGSEGGACLEGGTCAARLLCVGDQCADLGAVSRAGLEGENSAIGAVTAGFHLVGQGSPIGLVEKKADGRIVVTQAGLEPLPEIGPGHVLAAAPDQGDFLVAVASVEEAGGLVTVTPRAPKLDEAFEEATLRLRLPVDWSRGAFSGDGAAAARVEPTGKTDDPDGVVATTLVVNLADLPPFSLKGSLEAEDGVTTGVMAEVAAKFTGGTIRLDAKGTYDLDLSLSEGVQGYVGLEVRAVQDYVAELTVKAEGSGSFELPPFLSVPLTLTFGIPAGLIVVPVWVDLDLTVAVAGDLTVSGEAKFINTVKKTEVLEAGGYLDGASWRPFERHEVPSAGSSVEMEGAASAEASLGFRLTADAKLYSLAGPVIEVFAGLNGKATLEVTTEGAQIVAREVAGRMAAEIDMELPDIAGFEVPDFKATVLDYTHPLFHDELCLPSCGGAVCGSGGCPVGRFPSMADACGGVCGEDPVEDPVGPDELVKGADGVVEDPQTGLWWHPSAEVAATGQGGQTHSSEGWVKVCEALVAAGRSDWRLASIDEYRTLLIGCAGTQVGGACQTPATGPANFQAEMACHECEGGDGPDEEYGCYMKKWPKSYPNHCMGGLSYVAYVSSSPAPTPAGISPWFWGIEFYRGEISNWSFGYVDSATDGFCVTGPVAP